MRVLYPLNSEQIGGGNKSMMSLWNELLKSNITPIVTCPKAGEISKYCENKKIKCYVHPNYSPILKNPIKTISYNIYWLRLLRNENIEVIHSNGLEPTRSISLAAKMLKIPHVCHIRYPLSADYLNWVLRYLPKPDVFVFNSYALKNQMIKIWKKNYPFSKIKVIHNALNINDFKVVSNDNHKTIIGIVANLLPVKGHKEFIEMAKKLEKDKLSAEYWIIGEDIYKTGYKEELIKLANEEGLNKIVKFHGYKKDIPRIMSKLSVLVSCSYEEPFGRSLIEGMASGLPIVATTVGGIPEVVENNKTGYLVEPKSPSKMAAKVKKLAKDSVLRKKMGDEGRERVKKFFNLEDQVKKILGVYKSL